MSKVTLEFAKGSYGDGYVAHIMDGDSGIRIAGTYQIGTEKIIRSFSLDLDELIENLQKLKSRVDKKEEIFEDVPK